MIIDARRHPPREPLDCDVCVIGAGAAGLTLAMALREARLQVCVLEGGGANFASAAQRLLEGDAPPGYPSLQTTRLAALGGSTRVWAGWGRPLDAIDLERRAALPWSGWPISSEELAPYYSAAHTLLGLPGCDYDVQAWESATRASRLALPPEAFETILLRRAPVDFATLYRRHGEPAGNTRVFLHAAVSHLAFAGGGASVSEVHAVTPTRARFRIRPRITVLAAGGIGNAHVLLLSGLPGADTGAAITRHPWLGRGFTEHGFLDSATFVPADPRCALPLYQSRTLRVGATRRTARAALSAPAELKRRAGLLNAALYFRPAHDVHADLSSGHLRSLLQAWDMLRWRAVPDRIGAHLAHGLRAPVVLARYAWQRAMGRGSTAAQWRVRALFECAPDPDDRIELTTRRDALDRPLPRLIWRMRTGDIESLMATHRLLDQSLQAAGLGRLVPRSADAAEWLAAAEPALHHLGGTRMHDDPALGVVDRNARAHGVDNLYIAGGSVFPTGGFANPTLTIVALSLRLAEHLRGHGFRPPPAAPRTS